VTGLWVAQHQPALQQPHQQRQLAVLMLQQLMANLLQQQPS
jgi:hypothetical protein